MPYLHDEWKSGADAKKRRAEKLTAIVLNLFNNIKALLIASHYQSDRGHSFYFLFINENNMNEKTIKIDDRDDWSHLRQELMELDKSYVEAGGINLKPSQCYRITGSSLNVMFNTNCPDDLKEKINSIIAKYADGENYPPEQEFFFP
ncbi:MAG: hypothetical protein ABUT20_09295 [Bacteroidota bacterium]